jgi:hypothetical protein
MDSEELYGQESQGKEITQQDVEALNRRAERVEGMLKLRTGLQSQRRVEAFYSQVSEKLNKEAAELNRQLAEGQRLIKRLEEALNRQTKASSRLEAESNNRDAALIRHVEEEITRHIATLTAELHNGEAELVRRTKELNDRDAELVRRKEVLNDREAALQKALSLEDSIAKNIVGASNGDFQRIAASQIELGERYYKKVLQQANFSFWWALFAAVVGLFFFLVASGLLLRQLGTISNVSLISGVVVEIISGIGFTLYAHASRQLASFHVRLDKTLLFLFANTVCEHLQTNLKETTRAELVLSMANSSLPAAKKKTRKGFDKIANSVRHNEISGLQK